MNQNRISIFPRQLLMKYACRVSQDSEDTFNATLIKKVRQAATD